MTGTEGSEVGLRGGERKLKEVVMGWGGSDSLRAIKALWPTCGKDVWSRSWSNGDGHA